jgi:4-oxalocrotonate tautomerase
MPIIEMHLMEGRTVDQKRRVAAAMTEAIVRELGVPIASVRILITEHGGNDFSVGGVTMAQRRETENQSNTSPASPAAHAAARS